jgi:hypothetical protein
MKRKLLILFFVVLNVQAIKAKDALGYYITNELDTIKVIFDVPFDIALGEPSYEKLQSKIKYWDSQNKKQTLKPEMATEVHFNCNGKEVTLITLKKSSTLSENESIFLHVLKDGEVRLLKYYKTIIPNYYKPKVPNLPEQEIQLTKTDLKILNMDGEYFIQRNQAELQHIEKANFVEEILDVVYDCTELVKKIEDKKYKFRDLEKIIEEYNNCLD